MVRISGQYVRKRAPVLEVVYVFCPVGLERMLLRVQDARIGRALSVALDMGDFAGHVAMCNCDVANPQLSPFLIVRFAPVTFSHSFRRDSRVD